MKCYDAICKPNPAPGFAKAKNLKFSVGGTLEKNRKIARQKNSVLLNAFTGGRMEVDSAVVQVAKDNDVTFAIGLSQFLEASKYKRARLLVNYRRLVKLCLKYKARVLLVTDAQSEMQVRSPLQLIAFGELLGLSTLQAKWSISKVPEYLGVAK